MCRRHSDWVHVWYSIQLLYFMPIRYLTYHKRGYQYFMADLCYFVNLLLLLSIWVFPNSRRLMISTYCLAYGNNAWAIAMWRNSLVFHSLDKVTSLFIHIMPPVVLHCLVHLLDQDLVDSRFPSISRVKGVEKYGLIEMVIWATVPYGIWQLSYHLFITVGPSTLLYSLFAYSGLGEEARKNCCWTPNVVHLASQELFKDLDWQTRPPPARNYAGTCIHVNSVLLRCSNYAAMSFLVLSQELFCSLPNGCRPLEYL